MFQINTTSFLKCCHLTNNIELGLATPAQAWWTAQFFMQFHADCPARWEAQGHGWGQRWKSKHGSNIQLTHPFRSMSIWHPIPELWLFQHLDLINQRSRSNDHNIAQLQVQTIPQNFKWHYKSIQQFQRYGFRKVWPKCCLIWQVFGPWASPYGANNYDAAQLQV